jgi:hypothetical protein
VLSAIAAFSSLQWSRAVVARDEAVARASQWAEVARVEAATAQKVRDAWAFVHSAVERFTTKRLEILKEPAPPVSLTQHDVAVMRILLDDLSDGIGPRFATASLKVAQVARTIGDKSQEADMIRLSILSIKKLIVSGAADEALEAAQALTTFAPDDLAGILASAHVLMFHNQTDAAVALHKLHAGKTLPDGTTWDEVAQQDFADFLRCGRQHSHIAAIQKLLKPANAATTGPCPL